MAVTRAKALLIVVGNPLVLRGDPTWGRYVLTLTRVEQRSKALHLSARGVTTDPGMIPGCITNGRDRESHRAALNWPSVIRVRGGFGWGRQSL